MAINSMLRCVETDEYIVHFDDSQRTKDKLFKVVSKTCLSYDIFSSETVQQTDHGRGVAIDLLSRIVDDILAFKVTWK